VDKAIRVIAKLNQANGAVNNVSQLINSHPFSAQCNEYSKIIKDLDNLSKLPESDFKSRLIDEINEYLNPTHDPYMPLASVISNLSGELVEAQSIIDNYKTQIEFLQGQVAGHKESLANISIKHTNLMISSSEKIALLESLVNSLKNEIKEFAVYRESWIYFVHSLFYN